MAKDVITRFKLETTQYDSKIKEAARELSAYSKTATQAKEGFNQFTKANVEAAKALGTMATSTTNVKDRTKELVSAFNDAAKAYNSLTKEQQQSDWAQALAGSLTQLQQRIKETKAEMQGIGDGMKNIGGGGGSSFEDALSVFAGNMATKATSALMELGNEVLNISKESMQLAAQAQGVESAFARLNNPGLLDGLRQATHGTVSDLDLMKAAVKFDDFKLPVEELGTMLAFAQQKAKDTGQSVDYLVDSIVTGLGRQSTQILDNLGLSQAEVKERTKETGDMTKAVGDIIREQMAAAGDYVETAADRTTKSAVDMQNAMLEFGKTMQEATGMASWDELNNFLEADLIRTLNDIVKGAMEVKDVFIAINTVVSPLSSAMKDFGNMSSTVLSSVESAAWAVLGPLGEILNLLRAIGSASSTGTVQDAVDKANRDAADKQKFTVYLPPEDNWRNKPQSAAPKTPKARTPKVRPSRKTGGGGGHKTTHTPPPAEKLDKEQKIQKQINALVQEGLDMDEKSRTAQREKIAALQTQLEGYKKIKDELLGIEKKKKEVKPEKPTYTQTFTEGAVSLPSIQAYVSGLQSDIAKTDIGSKLFNSLTEKISDAGRMSEVLQAAMESGVKGADLTSIAQEMKAKLLEGDISEEDWQTFLAKINEWINNSDLKLKIDVDTKDIITGADEQKKIAAQTQKAWDMAAQSVGNLSTALNSIEDPAAKAAGTVIKAIADIALGFAQASVQAGSMGPWGWVAWLAAGTAALAVTISTVHSLTGFANGGIVGHAAGGYSVPGNSYSGDNIPIMANAGEVVLNRAQTGVLASALSEQSAPASSTPYVSGEKIYLGMENYLKRIGRGEIVTSRH